MEVDDNEMAKMQRAREIRRLCVNPDITASQVWACGCNPVGQLGLGHTKDPELPTEVAALHGHRIHAVVCGGGYTMAVVDDGELWATGLNDRGQLGLEDLCCRNAFTRVSRLSGMKVATVACGGSHTLALLETGELFAWGYNNEGQLGTGDDPIRMSPPKPVTALSGRRVVAIACGYAHSVALLETGELFAWGGNNYGELGLDGTTPRNVPTQVTALAGTHIVTVVCGRVHTAAISESGELFTWGFNAYGQLGHGDITEKCKNMPQLVAALRGHPVAAVACCWNNTLVLTEAGEVLAWGLNMSPQLKPGETDVHESTGTPQPLHFFDGMSVVSIHQCGTCPGAVVVRTASGHQFMWDRGYCSRLDISAVCKSVGAYTPGVNTVGVDTDRILSVAADIIRAFILVQ